VVIARRDPGGMVAMPSKPYIVIPAALRRRCGPGDRVLLAVVFPDWDALASYSFEVVDQALRSHAPARRRREAGMSTVNPGASQQAVMEAVLVPLERMGLSPADLTGVRQVRRRCRPSPSTSRSWCRWPRAMAPAGRTAHTEPGR
jgi:hypothetical protein